jgi:TetR/AcrR family transcriptional regulator
MKRRATTQKKRGKKRISRKQPTRPTESRRRVGKIRFENSKRILAAAEAVFSERGYEGATTALIAKRAGLPKANVHYYFPTKLHIYRAVIKSILDLWHGAFDKIRAEDDPATALAEYIRIKVEYSRSRPLASRVFASEIISGAPVIKNFLLNYLRQWVRQKCDIFERWVESGKMARLPAPEHLFFVIWAATQTYADFYPQVCAVLGKKKLSHKDYEAGTELITRLILTGCGIDRSRKPMSRPRR